MPSKLKLQGFLKDQRVRSSEFVFIRNGIHTFDGLKLDEIQIDATIKSADDVMDLMKLLQSIQPCFG